MNIVKIHLNLFDAGGSQAVVNATTGYVNANTGETTAFGNGYTLDPGLKEYYDTDLLENSRDKRYFAQFGLRQALPKNKGKTMEWRKWDTLPPAMRALQEGVAPHGRKLGETYVRKTITQHGDFVRKSDVLDLHFVDDVGLAATEELGSAAAQTQDLLIRNELLTGTNVMVADEVTSSGVTANTLRWKLKGKAYLTSDMVAQCVTKLEADKVPELDGRYYVCVIHPYCAYDIRRDEDWVKAHEYAAVEEIFNGEIGELHNCRFIKTTNAKVWAPKPLYTEAQRYLTVAGYSAASSAAATAGVATKTAVTVDETIDAALAKKLVDRYALLEQSGANKERVKIVGVNAGSGTLFLSDAPSNTPADGDYLNPGEGGSETHADNRQNAVFACTFLGKDAYGIVDPDGAGLEMIYHDKRIAGGPLEQSSTIGYKFEEATAILYQERMLRLECLSKYSGTAQDVLDQYEDGFDEQYN